ncbi:hypothetical protein QYE76_014413 [Lolium multiflorum]|uniref:Integrase catalytic domain-containing protein n=1 Tax=Lolium multiflorum TaxID=4521 RepID=A0AAD8U0M2_LOLMU|nr:hypothetical protein QYE76_014413 [Lolium multiflorum]
MAESSNANAMVSGLKNSTEENSSEGAQSSPRDSSPAIEIHHPEPDGLTNVGFQEKTNGTSSGDVEEVPMPSATLGLSNSPSMADQVANLAQSTAKPIVTTSAALPFLGEGCDPSSLLTFDPTPSSQLLPKHASNELWRIILEGFKPYNPDKLTRREAVDSQLNNTALHMIQTSVGTKELHRVRNYTTAKEAWDGLSASCIGSESMRRNKYNALKNKAEGFLRLPDEDHELMYGRLLTVADAFRMIGATHINDSWIKEKYIECMMPFVPIDVKTLVGRECYSSLTSQQVVHEMQALKVLEENSHDSRNRALGMTKGSNLALAVNSAEEVFPQESYRASWSMSYPEDLEHHYHDHMEFHANSFWVDPSKAKEDNIKRNNSRGSTNSGPRTRSCYNCNDKRHFIAECPYENRETHGGRLIPKDKSKVSKDKYSKAPKKKFYNNKTKKGKRPSKIVLVTREEYSSDEVGSSSSEEDEESSKELAAIVTTNIPSSSLFDSPNENPHIKNAHCFMARSSLDTSIVLSTQEEYTSGDDDVDDEEDATSNGLVALASLSTNSSSPSEFPNEVIHVEEQSCLMDKSSEDYAAGGSKWVLDSGCTSHMTGGKNLVKELRPNINDITVSFGDNSTSEVLGFGKVVVAHNITLVDVMLVKTLGYNLLSVSALGKMGFAVFIDNDIVVLLWSKTLKVAFVGYREHNLYVVDFSGTTTTSAMCLFGKADVGWLWHRRLAHINMRTLQSLHKGNHIVGLMENVSFAKDRVCRACVEGKMHDSPHPSKTIISSKRILELLHVDLFGPVTHASLGAKKHCLVIVDDYSRYTWVYFLKTKDETQQIFIDFATEVQRQHNLLIMAIRSDNGSEFKNYTLNDFLSDERIRHQYSAAYTPQQNGVAERKNRTLMDMARSMMAEYKSRYNFWAEAISTACHSSNRLYLRKGLNKTPYEILTGNKPNISYFKVFGCKCFYKIKGVRLSKFAPKALEGIFVGYGAESHTYRIFDVSSRIIIESCSVKFEENDGSQVGQVDVCAGDEIPQDAIVRMGVGFFRPIEGHGVASREELCSTTVEPSSSQHQQTIPSEANDAPTQEQEQDPPSCVQDQGQDQPRIHDDQAHENEQPQAIEEAQVEGQDGDPNDQVDQVTHPRPRKTKEEIEARRLARRERNLELTLMTRFLVMFEMSMMGEMKFFLGFEIKQLREGTFINQAKYLQDMLKRFKMTEMKGVATPMVTKCHLALDPNGSSKKRGKGHVDEIEEEFEQTRPSKLTARQQSAQRQKTPAVRGKNIHVSVKNMQYLEYKELRDVNPYLTPRNNRVTDKRFHNKTQEEIFYEVYVPFKKGVAPQHAIDTGKMAASTYFQEAYAMCGEFGLYPIMELNKDYDVGLIQQFYATVHFDSDEAKTFRWMSHERLLESNLAKFGSALGYPRYPGIDANGWRCHDSSFAQTREVLEPLYIKGWGIPGKSADLLPTWDIMLRVYRETIGPKGGNLDELHLYEVDLMANSFAKRGTGERLDVMDYIYHEMWSCVMEKKLPAFAPYIMKLIEDTWVDSYESTLIHSIPLSITSHEVKVLRTKRHNSPIEDVTLMDEKPPSWASKLARRMRHIFCLTSAVNHRQYQQHAEAKKSRVRQKSIMRALAVDVSPPGSEESITPEAEWVSQHGMPLPPDGLEIESPPHTPPYPGATSNLPPGWANADPWDV